MLSDPGARSALLVIDMNRNHLDPSLELLPLRQPDIDRLIPQVVKAVDHFRSAGAPIVYVTTDSHYDAEGKRRDSANPFMRFQSQQAVVPGVGRRRTTTYVAGRSEIVAQLAPRPGDPVVTKRRYSSFTTTDLDLLLRGLEVKHVYLTGVNTNNCILSHAFEAFNRDYGVTVLADCCGSMNGSEYHEMALTLIRTSLGWVTTIDELINGTVKSDG
jgi:nicotinamidase-related amidase